MSLTTKALELSKKYKTLLKNNGISAPIVLAHFFAQLAHESGLKPISENLNYSAEGLRKTFGKYFTELESIKYARKPEAIANRVYANRMGNGDEASGDGWEYRGKGYIQLTGLDNYRALSKEVGIDYIKHPEKLLNEADAMVAAIWFWRSKNLTKYALLDDAQTVTKRINGGLNGYKDRLKHLTEMKEVFIKS